MDKIEVVKDHKKEIEFWLNIMSNPNINTGNMKLLNMCLEIELNRYLFPPCLFMKTDPPEVLGQMYKESIR